MKIKAHKTRKKDRFHIRLPIRYYNISQSLNKERNKVNNKIKKVTIAYATDFSETGASILVPEYLRKDDLIELNLSFPMHSNKVDRVSIIGHVRWVRLKHKNEFPEPRFDEFEYCCGLEFDKKKTPEEVKHFIMYWNSLGMKKK